tara:strand:+ start:3553 stop:3939 length:387 start_codon:yes stop_codon:yes gene_type:complete
MFSRALVTSLIIAGVHIGIIFYLGDLSFGTKIMYQALGTFWSIGFVSILAFFYGKKIKKRFKGETGTIKWFDSKKGYGFLVRDKGGDLFVHLRSVQPKDKRKMKEDARVRYFVEKTEKGPQAENVRLI